MIEINGKPTVSLMAMPLKHVWEMYNDPYTACECCNGTGVHTAIMPMPWGFRSVVLPCIDCGATGKVRYACLN